MEDLTRFTVNGISYPMVFVLKDIFRIGKGTDYEVEIGFDKGFYIGQYPVSQKLWKTVMGETNDPSFFKGDTLPIESVSWDDLNNKGGFFDKLNTHPDVISINQKDGLKFRLPSESMWEYAARGGNKVNSYLFAEGNKLKEVGWYKKNIPYSTMPIGLKVPNNIGLYDMSGNVFEWCVDVWNDSYSGIPRDGSPRTNNKEGSFRVVRGGSWGDMEDNCLVSYRNGYNADSWYNFIGFRIFRY